MLNHISVISGQMSGQQWTFWQHFSWVPTWNSTIILGLDGQIGTRHPQVASRYLLIKETLKQYEKMHQLLLNHLYQRDWSFTRTSFGLKLRWGCYISCPKEITWLPKPTWTSKKSAQQLRNVKHLPMWNFSDMLQTSTYFWWQTKGKRVKSQNAQ